jgi:hypothetical protein
MHATDGVLEEAWKGTFALELFERLSVGATTWRIKP